MSTACDSVGLGVSLDNETRRFVVLVSLHDEETPLDPIAFALLNPEIAANIGARILSAAQEAAKIQQGIDESDDPEKALEEWIERFHAGTN